VINGWQHGSVQVTLDFAGSGQWMRGEDHGIRHVCNNQLKGRVDSLCTELSILWRNEPNLLMSGVSISAPGATAGLSHGEFSKFFNGWSSTQQHRQISGMGKRWQPFCSGDTRKYGQWWPQELAATE